MFDWSFFFSFYFDDSNNNERETKEKKKNTGKESLNFWWKKKLKFISIISRGNRDLCGVSQKGYARGGQADWIFFFFVLKISVTNKKRVKEKKKKNASPSDSSSSNSAIFSRISSGSFEISILNSAIARPLVLFHHNNYHKIKRQIHSSVSRHHYSCLSAILGFAALMYSFWPYICHMYVCLYTCT